MNKIILALLVLSVLTICKAGGGEGGDELLVDAKMWERCQEQLTNFSQFYEAADSDKQDTSLRLIYCAMLWYTSDARESCEQKYSLSSADEKVKAYYQDCVIPAFEEYRDTDNNLSKCAEEHDKCKTCNDSETCKTHNKYRSRLLAARESGLRVLAVDTSMPKSPELYAIESRQSEDNCTEKPSSKCSRDTLKSLAYQSCQNYYFDKCYIEYYEANFKEDGCYDYTICQRESSALYLQAILLSVLAFFAF